MTPEELFAKCAEAFEVAMQPRSAGDKEYFAQDWLAARLDELGWPYMISGRNTYPDFWVGEDDELFGVEVKSLAFARNRPARADFDTNSTIPTGSKDGRDVYTAFFLYTGIGADPRPIHSFCFLHGDFLNADHELVHENRAVHGFASYGDAFIRNRKMYVFRTPFTILPNLLGKVRMIVPGGTKLADTVPALAAVDSVEREWAIERVVAYNVDLTSNEITPTRTHSPNAGRRVEFEVYAPA